MMRWMLAGCCGLALIHLSVALQISQKPRFCGLKTGRSVVMYCMSSRQDLPGVVQWYKAHEYNAPSNNRIEILKGDRIGFLSRGKTQNSFMMVTDTRIDDSGVYFCKINNTWGPGTEMQVARYIDRVQAVYRSKMKDGLMILQGLLLAVCIAAILMRKQKLLEKRDSIYEEPETDHIYEGLAIETCGGDLYEDLTVYTQADGAEAPWE